jgi:hypothetical protein
MPDPMLDRLLRFLRQNPGQWFTPRALYEHPLLRPSAEVEAIIRLLCRQAELGNIERDPSGKGFRAPPLPERADV